MGKALAAQKKNPAPEIYFGRRVLIFPTRSARFHCFRHLSADGRIADAVPSGFHVSGQLPLEVGVGLHAYREVIPAERFAQVLHRPYRVEKLISGKRMFSL